MPLGCRSQQTTDALSVSASSRAEAASVSPSPVVASAPSASPSGKPAEARHVRALDAPAFKKLVEELSEPDADFFSDNFISNETSYLQPALQLSQRPAGGAYIGVGPEQNFSYIAITKPERAFILDIRRDNLVLHLLYKAAFELAQSRPHFLALLTGRPFDAAGPQPGAASIEQVFTIAERQAATAESYAAVHKALRARVEAYGFSLAGKDGRAFERAHRAFFKGGLDLRFQLKENSIRRYPTLRALLAHPSPEGEPQGFLASQSAFLFLQQMQRENRIVPLVGDFAGDHALAALAGHLRREQLTMRSFYVSNVEQYLMQNGVWWKWQRNIAALPSDGDSIFIRGYLDQGKRHPQQMKGHRTATTLHPVEAFKQHKKPYPSMWSLATDAVL